MFRFSTAQMWCQLAGRDIHRQTARKIGGTHTDTHVTSAALEKANVKNQYMESLLEHEETQAREKNYKLCLPHKKYGNILTWLRLQKDRYMYFRQWIQWLIRNEHCEQIIGT